MTSLVALAVIGAAALHAGWNALLKGRAGAADPLVGATGLALVWALLALPLFVVTPPPSGEALPFLLGSVACHAAYFSLLVAAYRGGDLSFVYTVARGLPPALVCMGMVAVANERPSAVSLAGVLAITGGVFVIGLRGRPPLRVALLSATCALFIAAYTMLDGVAVRGGSVASYTVWLIGLQGIVFSLGAMAVGRMALVRQVWARRSVSIIGATAAAGGYAVALWAMARAPVALVAALRETSVLFAALIGTRFLGEPMGRRRLAGAALVAAGAVLVRMGA